MRESLKAFITGVATRWWFWAVVVLSSVTTFTGLYYPESLLERGILRLAPAFGLTIFLASFLIASFLTYKELYDATVRRAGYDEKIGDALHRLYQSGNELRATPMRIDFKKAVAWQKAAEAFLKEHLPGELRMFQTIGDGPGTRVGLGGIVTRFSDLPHKLPAQVEKLRLIMGRYEQRRTR